MRKNLIFSFIVAILCLASCKEQPFLKQYQEIKLLQWKQENELKYELDIADKEPNYQLGIALRYNAHFPHKSVKLTVTTTWPSGKTNQKTYEIAVRDEKGNHKGEVMGEMGDIVQIVEPNTPFVEAGKHKFSIRQEEAKELGGIQEVGVLVFKPKAK
jgi:gliding motility-associated lipoprotein GldH